MLLTVAGFRSFPSGHSSSSFAGLFYLSLYLAAKLHVLDQKGEVWRTVVVLIPTLAAACIAMSRIMDARHHAFDVLFGSALGVVCAWASYRQYFPPVSHVWQKGRAYPMRVWGAPVRRPVRGKVLVDADTLEVLDDRVADDDDNSSQGSRYELRRDANANLNRGRESSSMTTDPDMNPDLETGYGRVGRAVGQQATIQSQSTGSAFHDPRTNQQRHPRPGYAETDSSQSRGIRGVEHAGSEDNDDLILQQRAPLQSGEIRA